MSKSDFNDPEVHRYFAAQLFNHVWDLMDLDKRTEEENLEMTHAAHTSRYHWEQCGTPLNLARGEWQISRVYAIQALAEPAKRHGQRCLELCEEHDLGAFDIGFAYEALARAYAIDNQMDMVNKYITAAKEAANQIEKKEDRDWLLSNLNNIGGSK